MNGFRDTSSAESRLNVVVSRLLRAGLLLSVAILVIGVVLVALGRGVPIPSHTSLKAMPRAILNLEAGGFFSLGLFVLLVTPAARVVVLLVTFSRDRQWFFAGVSAIVLILLTLCGIVGLVAA
jgi:uncharacterized membrane protein